MDNRAVFVRTEKGEAEITARSDRLPHTAWLTLVMVDGRTSVSELSSLKPKLHEVEQSLRLLTGEKFIDVTPAAREERVPPPTLEAEWSAPPEELRRGEPDDEEISHERVVKTSVRRKRRLSLSFAWLRRFVKRSAVAVVALLLLAVAASFLFPLSIAVPHVEKMLSEKMRQPVSVAGMRFVLDPRPAVVLKQVSVGPVVKIGSARVVPDLRTMHRPVKIISAVELESSAISMSELATLAPLIERDEGPFRVRTIAFREFKVDAGGVMLGPLTGDARLDEDAIFESAVVSTPGLTAEITPAAKDYRVNITGRNWQLPVSPALMLDDLRASGTVSANALSLPKIEAGMHGGTATGAMQLSWAGGWSAEGAYAINGLNLETLIPVFSRQFSTTGTLGGDYRFAAKSNDLARLFAAPKAEANFKAARGILQNADIVEALKKATSTRGGKTHFDELSGAVSLADNAYRFKQCKLVSGVVNAIGQFNVSADDQLAGRMNVEFKPIPSRGTMAMQIGGTISDPVLKPVP